MNYTPLTGVIRVPIIISVTDYACPLRAIHLKNILIKWEKRKYDKQVVHFVSNEVLALLQILSYPRSDLPSKICRRVLIDWD